MNSDRIFRTAIGLIFTLVAIDLAAQGADVSTGALASSVEEAKLIVSKNYEFALMGNAVSIDGNRAVVGVERDDVVEGNQGTVYVYEFDGADWIQTHQINAADGESGDNFGSALALEGDDLLVGAGGVFPDGAVYVFEYDSVGDEWLQVQKILPSNTVGSSSSRFGGSLSLSAGRLLVGAEGDSGNGSASGAAWFYQHDGSSWVEVQKVLASDGAMQEFYGWSVSLFGFRAVIGAVSAGASGAAYVYEWNESNGTWDEMQKIVPADGLTNQYFGSSAGLSGNDLVIGAGRDDTDGYATGAAYYYLLDGGTDTWNFVQKIFASDSAGDDFFAENLALQDDRLVVGAYSEGEGAGGNSGAVYVYEKSGGVWLEQARLKTGDIAFGDSFGTSVALDGNRLLSGAQGDSEVANSAGAAYVFDFDGSNWTETQKLLAIDAVTDDHFSRAVDIDGTTAVVGADSDSEWGANSGKVYVFDYNGIKWSLSQTLIPDDPAPSTYFGADVSLDGDWLAITAHVPQGGFVYVFKRTDGNWQQHQKLTASDNNAGDFFGRSVELRGARMIVGATFDDDLGASSGSAYVFDLDSDTWTEAQKLLPDDGAAEDYFGQSVAIDGDRALIGAWSDHTSIADTGSAYVFELDTGLWSQTEKLLPSDPLDGGLFGFSVALQNDWAMVGAHGDEDFGAESGAVYVFEYDAGSWSELQKITPEVGAVLDRFGRQVALDGNRMVVGANLRDTTAPNAGAVFSYDFNGVNWSFDQEITAGDAAENDYFGHAVGVDGNRVIAGAWGDDNNWIDDGAAYVINIANRYDLIVNVTGLFPGNQLGDTYLGPNQVTFTNAGDSVVFTGGQAIEQVISNLADGESYDLMFSGDPTFPNQDCEYIDSTTSGVINGSDVMITMECVTLQYDLSIDGGELIAGTEAVVSNQTGDQITVPAGAVVTFPTQLDDGSIFELSVDTQPTAPNQTCTFYNEGVGRMHTDWTMYLECSINPYSVGGTVSGLSDSGSLTLRNNGLDDLAISNNGGFTFSTALDDQSDYEVTVFSQPTEPNQVCVVAGGSDGDGSGTLAGQNVTSIQVTCTTVQYTVGGTLSGLVPGSELVLTNNGVDPLTLTENGDFTFTDPLDDLSAYEVAVSSQPATPPQSCTVENGQGDLSGALVDDVVVTCVQLGELIYQDGFEKAEPN